MGSTQPAGRRFCRPLYGRRGGRQPIGRQKRAETEDEAQAVTAAKAAEENARASARQLVYAVTLLSLAIMAIALFLRRPLQVRAQLESGNGQRIVSVTQDDNQDYCLCEECKRVDAEEGSHAGTMLRFVNAIAADIRFPHG